MFKHEYRVRVVRLASGERLPVLVGPNGLPLFEPDVFAISALRARSHASNTIGNALRSILVFHLFLDLNKIDFERRLNEARLLSLAEIEYLVRLCRMSVEGIGQLTDIVEFEGQSPSVTKNPYD
jgi:hypothetical protein